MADILKLVGAKIRDVRKEKELSQEALGEEADFHFSYIGGMERGERNVSLTNLAKIAECLDVEIQQLFDYVHDYKAPEINSDLNEIILLLINRNPKELKMAQKILSEIFNTYK